MDRKKENETHAMKTSTQKKIYFNKASTQKQIENVAWMCNATHSKLRCWRKVVPTAERKFQHHWKTDEKAKSEK